MNPIHPALAGTIIRACKRCRTPLTGKRPHAVYCTDLCSKRFRRPPKGQETRTSPKPGGDTTRRSVRVSDASGRLSGLLAELEGEAPGWIASLYTGRTFPRTYAEHGLPLPDYLRVRARR